MIEEPNDEEWGFYEGECAGCDLWGRINDLGLCMDCADKLERDLVRERDWDYSALAFLLSGEDREKLRQQIIREHGKDLELIAPIKRSRHKKHPRLTRRAPSSRHPKESDVSN
jgi:hypothetical protein